MAKPQPVPPANRSPKGPGDDGRRPKDDAELHQKRDENIEQQGDRANVKQNKTPQIQQPDRWGWLQCPHCLGQSAGSMPWQTPSNAVA